MAPAPATPTAVPTQEDVLDNVLRRLRPIPDEWRRLLGEYPWPLAEVLLVIYGPTPPNAQAPLGCATGESYGDPWAQNGESRGLLQIHYPSHQDKLYAVTGSYDAALLFDPEVNIAIGAIIWADQGFGPWSCRPGE